MSVFVRRCACGCQINTLKISLFSPAKKLTMIFNDHNYAAVAPVPLVPKAPVTYHQMTMITDLVEFVLELEDTVDELRKIKCQCGPVRCHKLLPPWEDLRFLQGKVVQLMEDANESYQNDWPLMPTKFNFLALNAQLNQMVEKVLCFCFVHTGKKYNWDNLKIILRYVSGFFSVLASTYTRPLNALGKGLNADYVM